MNVQKHPQDESISFALDLWYKNDCLQNRSNVTAPTFLFHYLLSIKCGQITATKWSFIGIYTGSSPLSNSFLLPEIRFLQVTNCFEQLLSFLSKSYGTKLSHVVSLQISWKWSLPNVCIEPLWLAGGKIKCRYTQQKLKGKKLQFLEQWKNKKKKIV